MIWIDSPFPVVSLGLARAIELKEEIEVRRSNGVAPEDAPSVIVLHVDKVEDLPAGFSRIEKSDSETTVLVFSMHIDLALARAALRRGARGFIHAGMEPEHLVRAISVASQGEIAVPRELVGALVKGEASQDLRALTHRQREILELVADGLTNAQIANRLFLSESTIKQHLRSAFKLLNVSNRIEASRLIRSGGQTL